MNDKTFEQCRLDASGTVYADWEEQGYRCLVMRGPSSLCAYIGVKPGHILYKIGYDDIPAACHGGLTFSGDGESLWPAGWWWIGWDYAHCNDKSYYDIKQHSFSLHAWTPGEVKAEFAEVLESLKRIKRIEKTTYSFEIDEQ